MRRLPILGMLAFVAAFAEPAFAGGQVVDLGPPAILQTSDAAVPPPPAPPVPLSAESQPGAPLAVPPLGPSPAPPAEMTVTPNHGPTSATPNPAAKSASTPPARGTPTPAAGAAHVPAVPQEGAGLPLESAPSAPEPAVRRLRNFDPPPVAAPASDSTAGGPQTPTPPPSSSAAPAGPPLVFRTADVVRPDLMRGANYRLSEYAPLVDYKFQFELETPWGTIPAHGMAMLGIRMCELKSIEYGSRIAHKNPMFVEGVAQVACKTPVGAYILVTDPIDSLCRTAEGLKRIAVANWSPGGVRANCGARRKLGCLLCCDPESHNPVLSCLLDDMSANAAAGWLSADVAVNFGLPGLGFLAANAEFKQMMAFKSTREIQVDLCASLTALGIPETISTKFLTSENYTTTQKMAFVYYLRKLVGIDNLTALVEGAVDTINEAEAMASIQELQLLVELRHTHPIVRVTFLGMPIVTLADGSQVLASSDDYLVETPRLVEMIGRFRAEFPNAQAMLISLGRVSTGAEQQFLMAGIAVAHHRFGDEDFNVKAEKAAETALIAAPATGTTKR